jgi:hypothetical protein
MLKNRIEKRLAGIVTAKVQEPAIHPVINHHPFNAVQLPSEAPGVPVIQDPVAIAGNMVVKLQTLSKLYPRRR